MPAAGAVIPPGIKPLRHPVPGCPSTSIDTTVYLELDTESPDCKIYFSTDGTKPNPFQLRLAGRETTFKYRGPFTLKPGKRTLKVVAVSRDGLQESNVVTKTFQVADGGAPSDDPDCLLNMKIEDLDDDLPASRPVSATKKRKPITVANRKGAPREAWATSTAVTTPFNPTSCDPATTTTNSVSLPEGPFNPTNYSGTQVNFWGVAPPGGVAPGVFTGAANPYPSALGAMTNRMLTNLEKPTVSVTDLKRWMQQLLEQQVARDEPPAIEQPKESELKAESAGNGDWAGQLEHICAHLSHKCKMDIAFRTSFGKPKLGQIIHADFDDEDDAYLLTISIAKPGRPLKPKAKPAPVRNVAKRPEVKPPEPVKETAKPKLKAKAKPAPKSAPKAPPKEKLEDPFFQTEEYEQEGTLKPWPAFDAERDCEKLRKAMKGMGTDEKAIIDILGYRSSPQRQEVVLMFKTMFGKGLKEEMEGETSGNLKRVLSALCLAPADYDASEIHRAVKGLGTDEDALIEILCTRTNAQIKEIRDAYKKLFNKELEKDVKGDTSGYFKKLLVSQIQGNRDESPTFDRTAAKKDAKDLFAAGEAKWGTDESTFNLILCKRSFSHLRAVFEEYKAVSKKDIEEAVKSEFSGDIKSGLVTVVRCIREKPAYFAQKLKKGMKGLGTDDESLVRIVVTRCESDMVQIKAAFERLFSAPLTQWIKDDTSGDYREMLLALMGERAAPEPSAEELEEAQEEQEMEEVEEEKIEEEGTVKPADPFDANGDCEVLRKAMKGLGTDEKAIIGVLTKRSNEQRQAIVKTYMTMFGKDLKKELRSEISGNFRDAILGLCQTSPEFDANQLRKAMKGLGTDEACLVEIICTRSSAQMTDIVKTYKQLHNRKLEEDIISETSGHLKRLLVAMIQANRPDGNMVNRTKARKDAKALNAAGEDKFGTDESRFNVILCSRSNAQLRATFEEYEKAYAKDIGAVIKSEMSGDLQKGMLTIVQCLRDKAAQFALRLYECTQGLGTDDETLVRTVVSRCEVDMVQIKRAFETSYKQPLAAYIADDISGDYLKTILGLIGEENFKKK